MGPDPRRSPSGSLSQSRGVEIAGGRKIPAAHPTAHEGFTVTRVQIDLTQRDARIAAALLDEVRAKLALLKAGSREEDITEARSRRDAAKGRVDEAATRLGYCSVDAPIGGIVLSTMSIPGQFVSATVPLTLLTRSMTAGGE